MANLITAISARKVERIERMARKAKKKVKQAVHNAKKRTIGSDNISPDTLEKFNNFWKCFDESKIKELMKEGKISEEESSLIKYLSYELNFGEFANKFDDKSELDQLYEIDFPKNFKKGAWKAFVENVKYNFNKAKGIDSGSNPASASKEEEAAKQKAGDALKECYEIKDTKYDLKYLQKIIDNIGKKIEKKGNNLESALKPVQETLIKINEAIERSENAQSVSSTIRTLTQSPIIDKISMGALYGLTSALKQIPDIKEKLPTEKKERLRVWNYNAEEPYGRIGDAWKEAIAGKQNQTDSNSPQQTDASKAATPNGQQEPSGEGESPDNSQIGESAPIKRKIW